MKMINENFGKYIPFYVYMRKIVFYNQRGKEIRKKMNKYTCRSNWQI